MDTHRSPGRRPRENAEPPHGRTPDTPDTPATSGPATSDGGVRDGRARRRCARCGWPPDEPYEVVSRHTVTEGVIVYSRCACGILRVWLHRTGGAARLVVGARSTLPARGA